MTTLAEIERLVDALMACEWIAGSQDVDESCRSQEARAAIGPLPKEDTSHGD